MYIRTYVYIQSSYIFILYNTYIIIQQYNNIDTYMYIIYIYIYAETYVYTVKFVCKFYIRSA